MGVWYNPLGTRVIQQGTVPLAAGAVFVFGFNGMVHLDWPAGAPSQAYFEFDYGAGVWVTLFTFLVGGGQMISVMVANGLTRVRRQAAGVGLWNIRFGGWQFV